MLDFKKVARLTADQRAGMKVKLQRIKEDGVIVPNAQRSLDVIVEYEAELAAKAAKKAIQL
jgi:hypothetical protein